jgi:hypothetical protein
MFLSSTVPVIHENTIILAATSPTVATGGPCDDGWFLSDFYAFNFLFKGLGSQQKWLTAADPRKLVERYTEFLHGNPYEDRKVCLSQELLDNNRLTDVTLVKPRQMIERFLTEAKAASELARRRNAPLLLLIFCHGLPSFQLVLNDGDKKKGLRILSLKGVLEPGAQVTLVTTACYSGGWVTHANFNYTTMTGAASRSNLGLSNAWSISQSIGRTCGSVFASTLIETLSSAASPLLDPSQRTETASLDLAALTLQPEEPTERQAMTYNSLCHSIWRTCEDRVTTLWDHQGFRFGAQDDAWSYSWTGRTGIPLASFERRWNTLAIHPYTPCEARDIMNPNPRNASFQEAGPSRTGGGQISIDEMTKSTATGRVKEMGRLFHQTCPGDWNKGRMVGFGGTLRAFYERDEYKEREPMFAATIRFQWEMALLTDFIVELFKLPVPSNLACIHWDRYKWDADMKEANLSSRELYLGIFHGLKSHFALPHLDEQGPDFYRPREYLAAAVYEANKSNDEQKALYLKIGQFMKQVKDFQQQRVCADPGVRGRARDFFKSVGRRARRSLSPRKSHRSAEVR